MTKKELSKLFGYSEEFFHKFFREAAKVSPSIKAKNNKSTVSKVVDYTLEECLLALSFLPRANEAQVQYLKENFIERDGLYEDRTKRKVKLSSDAQHFLFLYKNANYHVAVCNTCTFLTGRKPNKAGTKFSPYCNLYGRFLNKTKLNVYRDRCESYEYTEAPARLWGSDLPQNIDIDCKREKKTLGIDDSKFISKRLNKDDPIVLLSNQSFND